MSDTSSLPESGALLVAGQRVSYTGRQGTAITVDQRYEAASPAPDGLPEPGYYLKFRCLYPLPDGRVCCECEACQGMGAYASRRWAHEAGKR